jgi:hypothetical protein
MRRIKGWLVLPCVLSVGTLSLGVCAEARDLASHLQVSVFNDAGVSADLLADAETRAASVFAQSGIQVEWTNCGPADPGDFSMQLTRCSDISWPQHLSVRISDGAKLHNADIFGQSFANESGIGAYCSVYYGKLASGRYVPGKADLLGFVIAHELGHLLLGAGSHSAKGIMQANWGAEALRAASHGNLFFTTEQTVAIRSRLGNS